MLELHDVTKVYGSRKVVDTISFSMGDHEILGFLGPNGAGKSTTMNIIAGYTSASSGTVMINGKEILEDPTGCKKQIGYLPERPPLYPDMTVGAYLSFMYDLKKIKATKKEHIAEICGAVGIADVRDRIIRNLSKGYQQRVGLAQAMLGDPRLLILDEPTVGLDPKQILEVRDLIRELGKRSAIIFSSHILQEIQAVCGRIIIINNGALIADDTPEKLAALAGGNRLLLRAEAPEQELMQMLKGLPGLQSVEQSECPEAGAVEVALESADGRDIRRELFKMLSEKGWPILSLGRSGISLEDAFLRLTAGDSSAMAAFFGGSKNGKNEGGTV